MFGETTVSFIPAGLLCMSNVLGGVGILWWFLWFFIGFSTPAAHPRISEREREYIETSIAAQEAKEDKEEVR